MYDSGGLGTVPGISASFGLEFKRVESDCFIGEIDATCSVRTSNFVETASTPSDIIRSDFVISLSPSIII